MNINNTIDQINRSNFSPKLIINFFKKIILNENINKKLVNYYKVKHHTDYIIIPKFNLSYFIIYKKVFN